MATHKVLFADADTELLSVMSLHLRNEEYEAICASDGVEALTAAQREDPDVLVINVGLTVDESCSLHDELLDHPALMHIPIIYLVGERTIRLGGVPKLPSQSMIFKPVPTTELFEKIERAISGAATGRPGVDFYDDDIGEPAFGADRTDEHAA